jgi:hypothetical protein
MQDSAVKRFVRLGDDEVEALYTYLNKRALQPPGLQ